MKKSLKYLLTIFILTLIFTTNFLGHFNQMPMHVDSWQLIVKADYYVKQQRVTPDEPFSHLESNYPEGSALFLVVLSSLISIDLIQIAQFLPALFNVILALLFYLLAKSLFKNEITAFVIMTFTLLALSDITMLGIFYLAPVAFGIILSYLFFIFLIKKRWLFALLIFITILLTHSSSTVFSFLALFLYFLFDRENWKKIKYLVIFFIIGFIGFFITIGPGYSIKLISNIFLFEKVQPYLSVYLTLPITFLILTAIGFYSILIREKKARKFIIPIFSFLAINAFSYWYFKGTLLAYRRLFVYLYSMIPFFVGYSVWFVSSKIEDLPKIKKVLPFVKNYHIVLIILLVLLIPQAITLNIKVREKSVQWVTKEEQELFKQFGQNYPSAYLVADPLESFAFPYYNIKPVVLSPAHGANATYYYDTAQCFSTRDIKCFEDFFNRTEFQYLYTSTFVNSTRFEPFLTYENNIIYKFKG